MRGIVIVAAWLTACGADEAAVDAPPAGDAPVDADPFQGGTTCPPGVQHGASCQVADYGCWIGGDPGPSFECAANVLCICGGATYDCSEPRDGLYCGISDLACSIEGTGRCDTPPPGGGCECRGAWECFSGCPDGCPAQPPTPGDPCTVADTDVCRYSTPTDDECMCVGGEFRCCDAAPCP